MLIDAHVHFWKYDQQRDAWMNNMPQLQQDRLPIDLEPILSGNGVDGCVAVQADQSETETFFLCDLAQKHNCIKGIVGWVDIRNSNIEERLQHFAAYPVIKGWRHIVQAEPEGFVLQQDFLNGIRALRDHSYTYDLLIYPSQMKEAIALVNRFPDQLFVVDHCAKPYIAKAEIKEWAVLLGHLAVNNHVHCKLSGLLTEASRQNWNSQEILPYIDTVFELFGTERILFGSDWPVINVAGNYKKWKELVENYLQQFSREDRQKIMGDNAVKFYKL